MQLTNLFDWKKKRTIASWFFATKENKISRSKQKLPAIIIFSMFLFAFSFSGFSQNITFGRKNVSLQTFFKAIEKQTDYKFLYKPELLTGTKKITINVKNMPLPDALDMAFAGQPITYLISKKTITIKTITTTPKKEGGFKFKIQRLTELKS